MDDDWESNFLTTYEQYPVTKSLQNYLYTFDLNLERYKGSNWKIRHFMLPTLFGSYIICEIRLYGKTN